MLSQPKRRPIAIGLAIASTVLPLSGLHKFYLGQPIWGIVYLLLSWTPIPKIASLMEAVWYFLQTATEFHSRFNPLEPSAPLTSVSSANAVQAIADALRQLESLRQEGLISEYEFEQKRRQLLKSTP